MYLPNGNINVAEVFENAIIRLSDKEVELRNVNWIPHLDFKGVYLKNIVDSEKSNGMFSFHLMYIEPNAQITEYKLDGMLEVHSILEGDGICTINNKEVKYEKGIVHTINDGDVLTLKADRTGLKLLVIFAPAYWE